jgi:hypothetical protein
MPGFVFQEVHQITGSDTADTLVTSLCDGRVRITHRNGAAILDIMHDRFLLLEPTTSTYRAMSLSAWERSVRESVPAASGATGPDTLRFEAMGGPHDRIAGYECTRFHLYARRQVFPGEFENVEQEIWVAMDLTVPAAALATYARMQASLDRIGLDAPVVRPAGIALRTTVRRRPEGRGSEADEVETNEVDSVQAQDIPASLYQIPTGWTRADSVDAK